MLNNKIISRAAGDSIYGGCREPFEHYENLFLEQYTSLYHFLGRQSLEFLSRKTCLSVRLDASRLDENFDTLFSSKDYSTLTATSKVIKVSLLF